MAMAPLDAWLVRRMGWRDPSVLPTPDDIRRWQIVRLREVIEFARATSPFYARHFSEVDTSVIRSAEDFSRLPTMTPDHVREAPEQLLCVSQDAIARIVTLRSSGTTGRPKRIFHTTDDIEATVEYFGWGMRNLVREGQTAFVLMPGERPGGVGRLLADALDRTGAGAVVHGVLTDVREAVDHILKEKADCIVGSAGPCEHGGAGMGGARVALGKDSVRSFVLGHGSGRGGASCDAYLRLHGSASLGHD